MQGIENSVAQGPAHVPMLKKSLDFQASMASSLLAGAQQGNGQDSPQRVEAMQAQGKGQQLNTTV